MRTEVVDLEWTDFGGSLHTSEVPWFPYLGLPFIQFIMCPWYPIVALAFGLALRASAQQAPDIQWQRSYGGTADDAASCVRQTSDGGYIMVGRTGSNNGDVSGAHGSSDVWVVKADASGGIEWQRALGGTGFDSGQSIEQTSDGGYILIGNTLSDDADVVGYHGASDVWVVKLDENGETQWTKAYGGSNDDYGENICTDDDGYTFIGSTYSSDMDVNGQHQPGVWVVKIDNQGELIWQKVYGGTFNDGGQCIARTSDGGNAFIGISPSSDGDVSENHGMEDVWVVKLDEGGEIQWERSLGGSDSDYGWYVQQTEGDGYVLVCSTYSTDGDVSGDHGLQDVWVVKLNGEGETQWQRALGGSDIDGGASAVETSDGGFLVAASTSSTDGEVTGYHGGAADSWMVKLDGSGEIQWEKTLGGSGRDVSSFVEKTGDGGYAVSCISDSQDGDVTGHHGGWDFWLVKLSPEDIGIAEEGTASGPLLYPNPTEGDAELYIPLKGQRPVVEVFDALGHAVSVPIRPSAQGGASWRLSTAGMAPGVYQVHVRTNGRGMTRLLVKE